jgi:hypothetical protein
MGRNLDQRGSSAQIPAVNTNDYFGAMQPFQDEETAEILLHSPDKEFNMEFLQKILANF